jgi:hypothetical protein
VAWGRNSRTPVDRAGLSDRRQSHEVVRYQRATYLLHAPPARHQVTEVDGEEAGSLEQLDDDSFGSSHPRRGTNPVPAGG